MSEFTIYHNPRCSKSRQTLALFEENGISPQIVAYLKNIPSEAEIAILIAKLGIGARELMRKGEDAYKQNNLKDASLSEQQLIAAMHTFPKLIERPIVVRGEHAVLGRPPENILALID